MPKLTEDCIVYGVVSGHGDVPTPPVTTPKKSIAIYIYDDGGGAAIWLKDDTGAYGKIDGVAGSELADLGDVAIAPQINHYVLKSTGGAYAGALLVADDIPALDAAKITTGQFGSARLANDSVTSSQIAAGQVGNTELGPDAVTDTKLADNAVGNEHLQDNAVDTAEIADDAVTLAKMAPDTPGKWIKFNDTTGQPELVDEPGGGGASLPVPVIGRWKNISGTILPGTSETELMEFSGADEVYDNASFRTTTQTYLTIPSDGWYTIRWNIYVYTFSWWSTESRPRCTIIPKRSGSPISGISEEQLFGVGFTLDSNGDLSVGPPTPTASGIVICEANLLAGDTVEFELYLADDGGAFSGSYQATASIRYLGPAS